MISESSRRNRLAAVQTAILEIKADLEGVRSRMSATVSDLRETKELLRTVSRKERQQLFDLLKQERNKEEALRQSEHEMTLRETQLKQELFNLERIEVTVPLDADRLTELVPRQCDLDDSELPLVDRDDTLVSLVHIHSLNRSKRLSTNGAGGEDIVPILDSPFGMGKTTIGSRYLALVELNHAKLIGKYREEFLNELRTARTLTVSLSTSRRPLEDFVDLLFEAVRRQWKIVDTPPISRCDPVSRACRWIASVSKVFIFIDEIGKAFTGEDEIEQRYRFIEFVELCCQPMLRLHGVYFLLSGSASFLALVGQRPMNIPRPVVPASPVRFERVHLNPIRRRKILEILQRIVSQTDDGKSLYEVIDLKATCDGDPISVDQFAAALYKLTAGHPRSLCDILREPVLEIGQLERSYAQQVEEVIENLLNYPLQVKRIYDCHKSLASMNLSESFESSGGKRTSWKHVANRLFAGHGKKLEKTTIHIPPHVELILDEHFMPLTLFLTAYASDLLLIDKSRVFEAVLLKLFCCVFNKTSECWGKLMDGFIPPKSALFTVKGTVNDILRVDGKRAIKTKSSDSSFHKGISLPALTRVLLEYVEKGNVNVYFPAPQSCSQDFFLLPSGEERIVIGVAAKCYNSGTGISERDVEDEVDKFASIARFPRHVRKVVLMICATCSVGVTNWKPDSRSILWNSAVHVGIEVLIINLSTSDLRRDFFGLGASRSKIKNENSRIIENIIRHRGELYTPKKRRV